MLLIFQLSDFFVQLKYFQDQYCVSRVVDTLSTTELKKGGGYNLYLPFANDGISSSVRFFRTVHSSEAQAVLWLSHFPLHYERKGSGNLPPPFSKIITNFNP